MRLDRTKNFPQVVCENCHSEIEKFVDSEELAMANDVEPPPDIDPCALCGKPPGGDMYFTIGGVKISSGLTSKLEERIYACEKAGCGRVWDCVDKEYALDETNESVLGIFSKIVDGIEGQTAYEHLLHWLDANNGLEQVEFPTARCKGCGSDLDGWFQEVKTKTYRRLLPQIPTLPPEITGIPAQAGSPADLIEFYRSDCSNSLIHMTKRSVLGLFANNVDEEVETRPFSAQQVLYLILKEGKLRAFQGKGIHAPAVCFTEKTLTALKDTLLGLESNVRKAKSVIAWEPYGLLFPKEYLRRLGVAPVLHLSPTEESTLPLALKHRVVSFSDSSNWNHEREWRGGSDIDFDREQVTVLVPRFEQIAPFESALQREKIVVKGFLPLLDVFACI